MKYSLATNFDNKLIESIGPLGTIESVYGKFAFDPIGGGRPSSLLPRISYSRLKEHVRVCHNHGIKFNYLLNAMCMGNREVTTNYRKIFRFIDKILKTGVDGITIANTNLLRMFHKNYPEIPISSSIFLGIHTPHGIRDLEEEGVSEITLSTVATRNFKLLRNLVKSSKPETKLRLVANNVCLHRCLDSMNHCNFSSHNSCSSGMSPAYMIDLYKIKCDLKKFTNPTLFISSDWIRPEDVPFYDEIGGGKIILKLTDRSSTTDWLINVAKSYSQQKTVGNLMDILNFAGNREIAQIDKGSVIRGMFKKNTSAVLMKKIRSSFSLMPVYINSEELDGFLEGMNNRDCRDMLCNDRGWLDDQYNSKGCNYCREYAEKALRIDEPKRRELIDSIQHLIDDLYAGKYWQ